MSRRDQETYLATEQDQADAFLHALRSKLDDLEPADLADRFMRVIIQVWQAEGGREAVVKALEETS
jgi:hypothetical protein